MIEFSHLHALWQNKFGINSSKMDHNFKLAKYPSVNLFYPVYHSVVPSLNYNWFFREKIFTTLQDG